MRKVEIERQQTLLDNVFKVTEATVRFEKFNGSMSEPVHRLVFERGDSVAALIFNRDTQHVILTEQFRYPTYEKGPGWLREVVAGVIDQGEDPEASMKREIREEIGYEVHTLTYISTFYLSPGGSSERIMLYYAEITEAERVSQGGGKASENEDIRQVMLTLPELWQAIEHGEIIDAKTLIAAQWLQNRQHSPVREPPGGATMHAGYDVS